MPTEPLPPQALRLAAEKQLAAKKAWVAPAEADPLRLVHELQVHQIELEMQNEALVDALTQAEMLRTKFQDVFEHAPVGYFMLSQGGLILELNECATRLLSQPADKLVGRALREFVDAASLEKLDGFLADVSTTSEEVFVHQLVLRRKFLPLYVNLQARAFKDRVTGQPQVRLTMMDVSDLTTARADVVQAIRKAAPPDAT